MTLSCIQCTWTSDESTNELTVYEADRYRRLFDTLPLRHNPAHVIYIVRHVIWDSIHKIATTIQKLIHSSETAFYYEADRAEWYRITKNKIEIIPRVFKEATTVYHYKMICDLARSWFDCVNKSEQREWPIETISVPFHGITAYIMQVTVPVWFLDRLPDPVMQHQSIQIVISNPSEPGNAGL
jgi:hypothetical protein